MKLRELSLWVKIRESMWFLPSLLVVVGLALAMVTVYVDSAHAAWVDRWVPIGFSGGAEGARVILGTIASAMATVVSIAFSMAVIVLQLAAGQYSPHVITTFRRDRGQQIILGTYVATFGYSLMVLRQVRGSASPQVPGQDPGPFIPQLSMLVALVLAMICLGMLVYFVHHTSEQMRVSDIAKRIHSDLINLSKHLYPERIGEPFCEDQDDEALIAKLDTSTRPRMLIRSRCSGYLRQIHTDRLTELVDAPLEAVRVHFKPGEFVFEHSPLIELHSREELTGEAREELERCALECFGIGERPTLTQNPDLGTQQLVDIALRALSPGINDPTTAEQVMAQLGDWLGRLARRSFPSQVREVNGRMLVVPRPSFETHVHEAFGQVRTNARTQLHVLHSLLDIVAMIAETAPPRERLLPFCHQVQAIERIAIDDEVFDPVERDHLRDHARELLQRLPNADRPDPARPNPD